MAYTRFGSPSCWYIFWEARIDPPVASKEEEHLAVWHQDHTKDLPSFSYAQVRQMLSANDFSAIPGFGPEHVRLLHECLSQFVQDVDREYSAESTRD